MANTDYQETFPNVMTHRRVDTIKQHPDYQAAKNGDDEAAYRLVKGLVDVNKLRELKESFPNSIIAPIHAIDDGSNLNKIPIAYAEIIGRITGFEVDTNIIQSNDVGRTHKNAIERLVSRAQFEGEVERGRNYIIVDDVVTQGGTLSEFRSYIESNGGKVVAASTLGYTQYSTVLAIRKDTVQEIERRFGRNETESFLKECKIAGRIEQLTNAEGKYMLSYKSLNEVRERAFEVISKGISPKNKRDDRERPGIDQIIKEAREKTLEKQKQALLKHSENKNQGMKR